MQKWRSQQKNHELVIGLVHQVGTDHAPVIPWLKELMSSFSYDLNEIHITKTVMPEIAADLLPPKSCDEFDRINTFIDAGNKIRERYDNDAILALGAISQILNWRNINDKNFPTRTMHLITSLKHPEEVSLLREIYGSAFFLIGVYADESIRRKNLLRLCSEEQVDKLIERDTEELQTHGQHTRDTFFLSDFFLPLDADINLSKNALVRFVDLLFGNPFITPTFDEFAMFMAFSSALRSADLSRQVGAVVSVNNEIVGTGANDCPRFGGGLYWPQWEKSEFIDSADGRDYVRGYDSNRMQRDKIIDSIAEEFPDTRIKNKVRQAIEKSAIKDLTEFGRMVHAEMEALLACARSGVSPVNGTVHCTTFPCHNCAKHIIAAGIKRVVFIEPYPKSKALEFHQEAITLDKNNRENKVIFEPFTGIGPRKFFDLFSMNMSSGYPLIRKEKGKNAAWARNNAVLRLPTASISYFELEKLTAKILTKAME